MANVTFDDLVKRYGQTQAYDILLMIERLAKARDIVELDEDMRLQKALAILEEIDFAA